MVRLAGFDAGGACLIAVGPRPNVFKAWDVSEKSLIFKHTNQEPYTCITVSRGVEDAAKESKRSRRNRMKFLLGTQSGKVQIWDGAAMELLVHAEPLQEPVALLAVHPTRGTAFACGEGRGHVVEISLADGSEVGTFQADKSHLTAWCVSSDGSRLLTAGSSKVKLWSLEESPPRAVAKLASPVDAAVDVAISSDGEYAAVCDGSTSANLYALGGDDTHKPVLAVVSCHERLVRAEFAAGSEPLTLFLQSAEGNLFVYGVTALSATPQVNLLSTVRCTEAKAARSDLDAIFAHRTLSSGSVVVARGQLGQPDLHFLDLRPAEGIIGAPFRLKDVALPARALAGTLVVGAAAAQSKEKRRVAVAASGADGGKSRPAAPSVGDAAPLLATADEPDDDDRDLAARIAKLSPVFEKAPKATVQDAKSLAAMAKRAVTDLEARASLIADSNRNRIQNALKEMDSETREDVLGLMFEMLESQPFGPSTFVVMQWLSRSEDSAKAIRDSAKLKAYQAKAAASLEERLPLCAKMLQLSGKLDMLEHKAKSKARLAQAPAAGESEAESTDVESEVSMADDADHDFDDAA